MQLPPEEEVLLLLGPGQGVVDVVVPGSDVGGGWVPVDVGYAGGRVFPREEGDCGGSGG